MNPQPKESAKQRQGGDRGDQPRPELVGKRVERTEDGRYVIFYSFEDGPEGKEPQ